MTDKMPVILESQQSTKIPHPNYESKRCGMTQKVGRRSYIIMTFGYYGLVMVIISSGLDAKLTYDGSRCYEQT